MMLIERDHHKRPSAIGVLESQLLPDTLEDSKIKWVVRNLRENDYFHAKLLDVIFSRDDGRASMLYDPDKTIPRADTISLSLVQDACSRVFRRHAAYLLRVPLLTPAAEARSKDRVLLMDQLGCQYELPSDLTQPFAHFLARGSRQRPLRRFAFGNVYRARPFAACKESNEAAFDIVCAGACSEEQRRMEEAETMSVLMEVLSEVPLEKEMLLRVGHAGLMEGIMDLAGVPDSRRSTVREVLSQAQKKGTATAKRSLRNACLGLDCEGAIVESFQRVYDEVVGKTAAMDQATALKGLFSRSQSGSHAATQLIDTIRFLNAMSPEVRQVSGRFGPASLHVDPLLSHANFDGGLVFQAALLSKDKRVEAVAFGGRYDSLVRNLRDTARERHVECAGELRAVGLSVSVERVVAACRYPTKGDSSSSSSLDTSTWCDVSHTTDPTCRVLVCSRGGSKMATERLKLLRLLWGAGMCAEQLHHETGQDQLQLYGGSNKHLDWIVHVSEAGASSSSGGEGGTRFKLLRCKSTNVRLKADYDVASQSGVLETLRKESGFYDTTAGPRSAEKGSKNPKTPSKEATAVTPTGITGSWKERSYDREMWMLGRGDSSQHVSLSRSGSDLRELPSPGGGVMGDSEKVRAHADMLNHRLGRQCRLRPCAQAHTACMHTYIHTYIRVHIHT
jgi:histidyl-tRNA synthetase